jgi:phosphonoacetaldehyde hydrolase
MYRCFLDLNVWPAHRVLKVDDTVPGLMEARHAGCWTVAVTASGNEMGLTLAQWQALDEPARMQRLAAAQRRVSEAAPDYVIETVAALMPVVDDIERRLAQGERPPGV